MKSLKWMLVGGALVATSGCTTEDDGNRRVTAMYATTGGETSQLRGLAVDRSTYDMLVDKLGDAPEGVTADAPDGTVSVLLAPTSPLIATYLTEPTAAPPLTITFDDGTAEPVGMLLPAIQKVREAAVHGSGPAGAPAAGTIALTVEATAGFGGGVRVAVGDVTGDGRGEAASVFVVGTHVPGVSPEQRSMMGDAFVSPTGVTSALFTAGEAEITLKSLSLPTPHVVEKWTMAGAAMNLVIDIRSDGGAITRFRVPRAEAAGTSAPQGHVKVFDGTNISLSGDAERAMFDAGYATFTSDALDAAARALQDYANEMSMSVAIALWSNERTQTLADIIVATGAGGAAGYEAMACMAALPTALAAVGGLDHSKDEIASAAATAYEAATTITPKVGMVSGGTLALSGSGATAPTGDAELACAVVHQIASLPDTVDTNPGINVRAMSVELAAFDARRLDIELAAWVAAMDALVLAPNPDGWTAARAKADILIEALGNAATRTEARWMLAASMLGK